MEATTTYVEPRTAFSCDRRGSLLRVDVCDLCGGRGQPFEVYQCDLHGECSNNKKHSKVIGCAACPDRVSELDPPPAFVAAAKREERAKARQAAVERARDVSSDPATCQHRRPVATTFIDRTAEPWTATTKIVCRDCGAAFLVDGQRAESRVALSPPSPVSSSGVSSR